MLKNKKFALMGVAITFVCLVGCHKSPSNKIGGQEAANVVKALATGDTGNAPSAQQANQTTTIVTKDGDAVDTNTSDMDDGRSSSTLAKDDVSLDKTVLFTKTVHDCKELNLASWNHPTKQVLLSSKVKIERVQLCNAGKYPVFFVELPYDPQGQTDSYFNPLYEKMRKANGGWSYSLVATSDNTIVNVAYSHGIANVDYEMYKP